jgi:hypothetical protein
MEYPMPGAGRQWVEAFEKPAWDARA